ncbi:unnamed protein product [Periconia digitata]|uniref:Uncharacterized protein n=1 Tax=Periconia digitata TaxID=1303443 RepID=A0A9W4UDB0_9PLEO|nr:unnamed protein product [Periconia digitata]
MIWAARFRLLSIIDSTAQVLPDQYSTYLPPPPPHLFMHLSPLNAAKQDTARGSRWKHPRILLAKLLTEVDERQPPIPFA